MKPSIEITDKETLTVLDRMQGMSDAQTAIKALEVPLPGVKLALAAVEAEIQKMKCAFHGRVYVVAGKSGVDLTKWIPTGCRMVDDKVMIEWVEVASL